MTISRLCMLMLMLYGVSHQPLSANNANGVAVGDPFPAAKLAGSDGKTYDLGEFAGQQAMVIAWFPRAFTPGCTKECKSFRESGNLLRAFDVAYFTASCDDVTKNTEFAKSLDVDYPILSDPKGELATKLGIYNLERNAAKRVTYIVGKDGKIAVIDDMVDTTNHAKEVAEHLKKIGVAKK